MALVQAMRLPRHGDCVEVASVEAVAVCDTTDRDSVTLKFTAEAWQKFTLRLRGRAIT